MRISSNGLSLLTLCTTLFLTQRTWADFEDSVPKTFGDTTLLPAPTAPKTAPQKTNTSATTQAQKSEFSPNSAQPSGAPAITQTEPSGDFFSEDSFSDVKHNSKLPVTVNALDFKGSRKTGIFVLKNNVKVIQDNLTLNADVMDILTEEGLSKPKKILAKKNVHAVKLANPEGTDKVQAWAEEMEYNLETGKMILKNNAKITRGKNCAVFGDILEYNLNEGIVSGRAIRGTCPPANKIKKVK